jgi:hypothetical protein
VDWLSFGFVVADIVFGFLVFLAVLDSKGRP